MTKHNTKIEWSHIPGYIGESWNPAVAGLKPLNWTKPRSIFVNSMGDLFHEDVQDEWIDQVFAVMALCPKHIFMILTKHPDRMREYSNQSLLFERIGRKASNLTGKNIKTWDLVAGRMIPYLPNVWLGTSVEDQATADERIPNLLKTPAAVHFLSCEPLLGGIDFNNIPSSPNSTARNLFGPLSGYCPRHHPKSHCGCARQQPAIDWVIAGGESGPDARQMHPDWVRGLRDQCADAGVPFFFKQWGEFVTGYFDGDEYEVVEDCHGPCEGRGVTPCHTNYDMDPLHYIRVGKSRGGHMLDGKINHAWPECVKQQASEVEGSE